MSGISGTATDRTRPVVGIVMGSDSDWPVMGAAAEVLAVMAPLLGWSEAEVEAERTAYAERVAQIAAAEEDTSDAEAAARLTRAI